MTTIIKGDSNINLDFSTGGRITGDFSNATVANRAMFQSSTTNGSTSLNTIPNGTSVNSGVNCFNAADPTNAGFVGFLVGSTEAQVRTGITGTGTYLPMTFYTGGSERMRVDTSGNVGIGNAAANVNDQVGAVRPLLVSKSDSATTIAGSQAAIVIGNSDTTTSNTSQLSFAALTGANSTYFTSAAINCVFGARTNGQYPTGQLTFSTSTSLNLAPTEKMRIDSSGNLLVGTTTALGKMTVSGGKSIVSSTDAGYGQFQIGNTSSGGEASMAFVSGATAFGSDPTSTNGNQYVWAVGANVYGIGGNSWGIANKSVSNYVAKIAYNSTSWTFSSDERLKDLEGEIANALDKVSGLRAVYYTWKNDEAKKRRVGLIAQDVLAVLPEAVDKPEQATREDGTPNYLGLGMSDVVPLLVAAVKEQQAIITALTARVEALEGTQS